MALSVDSLTSQGRNQDEDSQVTLDKSTELNEGVIKRGELKSLFSEIVNKIENSKDIFDENQRNLSRNDYSTISEMLSDIYKVLEGIESYADDPKEVSKFTGQLKEYLSKKLQKLEQSRSLPQSSNNHSGSLNPTLPSSQTEVRSLNNLLQFIEKNDFRSLGYILKANSKLCRVYKKTSLYGVRFYWTALHMAACYGKTECVATLIKYGANVEDQDTWHKSRALGWAANNGHSALCKMLIEEYNADQYAVNASGLTAFDMVPDKYNPVWKGVFTAASRTSLEDPQINNANIAKKNASKSHIKLFIRPEWSNTNYPKIRMLQPQDKTHNSQNPTRPSLKIKLGNLPNTSSENIQSPLKKVVIKVPNSNTSSKSSVQEPQDQESPTQRVHSKIILRSRKNIEQKQTLDDTVPVLESLKSLESVTSNNVVTTNQSLNDTPVHKVDELRPNIISPKQPRLSQSSFVPQTPLQYRSHVMNEAIFPSISAISSSRFVEALKALKKTLVVSVGIVSDRDMIRVVVPIPGSDIWSGASLNISSNIHSLSVRLLMTDFDLLRSLIRKENLGFVMGNTRPSYTVSATQITKHYDMQGENNYRTQSYVRLKALPLVSNGPYVHDCCVVLERGLNKLELTVAAAIPEQFDVITQKIELFFMRS